VRLWVVLIVLVLASPVYAQTMGSSSGASSSVDVNSPASTTTRLITTPTIAAPGLAAAGVETCLGSTAGGLSLMGGGITFGSTKVDDGCTIRLLARQLYAFGLQKAALALMCQDAHVVAAMDEVGSPCPKEPTQVGAPLGLMAPDAFSTAAPQTSQPATSVPAASGGYILDLKPAAAGQLLRISSAQMPNTQVSYAPAPVSQAEQMWIDRASDIN
jgi:hypothetical protein